MEMEHAYIIIFIRSASIVIIHTHTPTNGLDTYYSHVNFHASHFVPSGLTNCNSYLTFVRFVWRGSHSLALYKGYRGNKKDKYYDKQCSRC